MSSFQEQFIEIEETVKTKKFFKFNELERMILLESLQNYLLVNNDLKTRFLIEKLIKKVG